MSSQFPGTPQKKGIPASGLVKQDPPNPPGPGRPFEDSNPQDPAYDGLRGTMAGSAFVSTGPVRYNTPRANVNQPLDVEGDRVYTDPKALPSKAGTSSGNAPQ